MLISLSGRQELCGVGRNLELDKARALGELAARHGFLQDGLYRHGHRVPSKRLERALH